MQNLILALTIMGLGYVALKWLRANFPRLVTRHSHIAGGVALIAIAIIAGAKGAAWLSGPLGSVGLWMLWSSPRDGTAQGGGFGGLWPFGGRTSGPRVTTDFLDVQRDAATGALRGRVLKGFFKGRTLERMRPVELAHLWQDCRTADPRSAELIEPFLDRLHPSWREDMARAEAHSAPDGAMMADEALEILGLEPGASAEDIRRAHRELMLRLHPDRGGSTYLAAKINQAKDILLTRKG